MRFWVLILLVLDLDHLRLSAAQEKDVRENRFVIPKADSWQCRICRMGLVTLHVLGDGCIHFPRWHPLLLVPLRITTPSMIGRLGQLDLHDSRRVVAQFVGPNFGGNQGTGHRCFRTWISLSQGQHQGMDMDFQIKTNMCW